jgi:hypothetical protein
MDNKLNAYKILFESVCSREPIECFSKSKAVAHETAQLELCLSLLSGFYGNWLPTRLHCYSILISSMTKTIKLEI